MKPRRHYAYGRDLGAQYTRLQDKAAAQANQLAEYLSNTRRPVDVDSMDTELRFIAHHLNNLHKTTMAMSDLFEEIYREG